MRMPMLMNNSPQVAVNPRTCGGETCCHNSQPHQFTSIHIHSHQFTSIHINSHQFTSIHIHSHPFTSIHINSHQITSIHINSHQFTSIHIHSHQFTSIHINSHQFTSIHIKHTSIHTNLYISRPPLWRTAMCLTIPSRWTSGYGEGFEKLNPKP